MKKLMLTLRFDGGAYHGWQVQKNGVTVQETLQNAIESVFGTRYGVTGCSRTDAGVHANMYCCCFSTNSGMKREKIIAALNAHLPDDIGVYGCCEVPDEFHPRYSCLSKEYIYKVWNSPHRNPFLYGKSLQYKHSIDEKALAAEASAFVGRHDFKGFASSGGSAADTVRNVFRFETARDGDEVVFSIEADGFLYNMARIMVGTMLDMSAGKIQKGSLAEIIASRDRNRAGATAPAYGLYLNKVFYEDEKTKTKT